jgi:hypothetical protein
VALSVRVHRVFGPTPAATYIGQSVGREGIAELNDTEPGAIGLVARDRVGLLIDLGDTALVQVWDDGDPDFE